MAGAVTADTLETMVRIRPFMAAVYPAAAKEYFTSSSAFYDRGRTPARVKQTAALLGMQRIRRKHEAGIYRGMLKRRSAGNIFPAPALGPAKRSSEERRVGKECRSLWGA